TQHAESRIRDMDMAEAMVEYSKYSILEQAGQAVLSQANQMTSGVIYSRL
ncbi:flagellin, partial [Frisingicoccus sp.]